MNAQPSISPKERAKIAREWEKLGKRHPEYQRALDHIDELEAAIDFLFRQTSGKARVNPRSRVFSRLWDLRSTFYNPVEVE